MLAAIAEFEHGLIVEPTTAGPAAARARGRRGSAKSKMTRATICQAREIYDSRERSVQEIADVLDVGRATIYSYLNKSR
jgi:DNA invertase Pin-like site-specific DNA recombinase